MKLYPPISQIRAIFPSRNMANPEKLISKLWSYCPCRLYGVSECGYSRIEFNEPLVVVLYRKFIPGYRGLGKAVSRERWRVSCFKSLWPLFYDRWVEEQKEWVMSMDMQIILMPEHVPKTKGRPTLNLSTDIMKQRQAKLAMCHTYLKRGKLTKVAELFKELDSTGGVPDSLSKKLSDKLKNDQL